MPTPVTENQSIETVVEETNESHLDAARDFLKGQSDEPSREETPNTEPKKTETLVEKKSPLGAVVKLPGAKEEPKKEETLALDELDKGLSAPREGSQPRAGWDELKKRGAEERRLRIEAEQKLKLADEKSKASPSGVDEATTARLVQLEQENKAFSERLKVVDLKSHPEFEAQYVKPQSDAKQALANIAKEDETEINIDELLSLKGKKFNSAVSEALDSLTPYARVKFQSALDKYISATLGAEQALSNNDETLKKLRANGGAKSRATFDSISAQFSGAFLPAQVDEKADDGSKAEAGAYNTALAQVSRQAEAFAFGQTDEKTIAEVAHKAALFDFTFQHGLPRIDKIFQVELSTRDSRITELEAKVKSLTAASPKFSAGSGAPAPGEGEEQPESHLEAARRFVSTAAR